MRMLLVEHPLCSSRPLCRRSCKTDEEKTPNIVQIVKAPFARSSLQHWWQRKAVSLLDKPSGFVVCRTHVGWPENWEI